MYRHIMVPLDGSELAECVLPHVAVLTKTCEGGKVSFVRVVVPLPLYETGRYRIPADERQRWEDDGMKEARKYLDQIVKQTKYDNVTTQSVVLYGKVDDELIKFANENEVDLIVIASHGRSGPSRWIWGSVADRILRSACVPVMIVRAPGLRTQDFRA